MTFARVTGTGMDEHGSLYSTPWGVSTGTFPRPRGVLPLTGFATDEYDIREMPSEPEGTIVSNPDPLAPGHADQPPSRGLRCPTCQRSIAWRDNPQRPFCSFTCRLVDLGVWLDEGYAVRGDPTDDVQ